MIKLVKKLLNKLISKLRVNIQRIAFEGVLFSVILTLLVLVLFSNIIRVIDNGQRNYSVYIQEYEGLEQAKQRNAELQRELEISTSDEYLQLFARDSLFLANPGEELFSVKRDGLFYEVKPVYLDLEEKQDYIDWWQLLVL